MRQNVAPLQTGRKQLSHTDSVIPLPPEFQREY